MNQSIMIVGVGGQGTLLASRLLGAALLHPNESADSSGTPSQNYDVKISEVHGMSQRGGSVVTYVKYSDEDVFSPIVDQGEADFILAFEQLEAARWLPFLKPGGKMIVNAQRIDPMPVITGAAQYPQGIIESLQGAVNVQAIDALALAQQAGSTKAVNVVLLGALAKQMALPQAVWDEAIHTCVKPQFIEMNRKAFALGYEA